MTDITMPRLSDSMEEGLVLQWLIEDGQPVRVGDELVEIETDKATSTYAAEAEGVLSIVVPAGTTVAVGELIAQVGARSGPQETAPATAEVDPPSRAPLPSNGAPERVPASATPVARRLAATHGVALAGLEGTGPRGRITKADVLAAAGVPAGEQRRRPLPRPRPPEAAPSGNGSPASGTEELTRLQRLVARRMAEAKATIPHFQVQTEVVMDRALALRGELKAAAASDSGISTPSVNDLIVKACAHALTRHPRANGSYREGRFELHDRVNIGIAVAADDALIVPTIFDVEAKSLGQIARESRRLADRVRSGEITPPELSGATFTVSNLGMFGMTAIAPVINPPQAAILGVGATRTILAREGDSIADRQVMTLTLSCDHRILYGADAARFLAEIRAGLEAPVRLCI